MGLIAVPHNASPYFELYDEDTLLKVVDFSLKPGANPSGNGNWAAFSPNGALLAIAHSGSSPYLAVYDTATWSRVTLTGGNPTGPATGVAFSPNSGLLAVSHNTSPYLTVYNTSTWAKVTLSGGNPANIGNACKFSPSGNHLAVGHWGAPYLTVYSTADWSKVTLSQNPSNIVYGLTWLQDGGLVVNDGSQFRVYEAATWTSELKPTTPLSYTTRNIEQSPDGTRLLSGNWVSGNLTLVNASDWGVVPFNNAAPSGATRFAFVQGGAACFLVGASSSPYLFKLDMTTLLFSGVSTGTFLADRWMPAVGGPTPKYLKTLSANPVVGPDGDPASGVTVRAHRRSDGATISSATTDAQGAYSIGPLMLDHVEAQVVFMDSAADPLYNDLIVRAIPG